MKVQMGRKEVDLSTAVPLTLGDIRKLSKEYGVKMGDLGSNDHESTHKILLYLARKAGVADITEEDVDAIPLGVLVEVTQYLAATGARTDRPTLG